MGYDAPFMATIDLLFKAMCYIKIIRRGRDKWKVTLRLRVVERWKGKMEVMVGSSGEK